MAFACFPLPVSRRGVLSRLSRERFPCFWDLPPEAIDTSLFRPECINRFRIFQGDDGWIPLPATQHHRLYLSVSQLILPYIGRRLEKKAKSNRHLQKKKE